MSKGIEADDVATFAISTVIDAQLKKSGEYKEDMRNKLASIGSSAGMGAVGAAIGGPVLGVLTGTLGHLIGQTVEFRDSEKTKLNPRRKKRLKVDYNHLPRSKFDYDKL